MPITYRDAEDAALAGWVQVQEFLGDFMKEWTSPVQRMNAAMQDEMVLQQWDEIPPEVHAQLEQTNPAGYKRAAAKVDEIRQKYDKNHPTKGV